MPRERILVIGGPGSGKTLGWIKLANYLKSAQIYVIDTEIGAERSLQEAPGLTNVHVYPVVEWPEYRKAQREAVEKAGEGDWIVLDMADKAWTAVQRYFIGEIFDQEMGDYFLEARKKMKKDSKSLFAGRDAALKGWTDWPTINRLYDDFMLPLVYRSAANLYMVSSGQGVSEDDDKEIQDLYGPYRLRPAGQKNLAHQPDTVLLFSHTKDGYFMSTIKDRGGRRYMDKEPLHNFALQYGRMIAGLK